MMISPETYYDEYLADKNEKEIRKQIREIKRDIRKLKDELVKEWSGENVLICHPHQSVQLIMNYEYLEKAKQALAEVGGVYNPTKAELKDMEFTDSIRFINKIVFYIGSCFEPWEKKVLYLDGEVVKFATLISGSGKKISVLPSGELFAEDDVEKKDVDWSKEEVLERIKELHVSEWKRDYIDENILDGEQWSLEICFSNGRKSMNFSGCNAYPFSFGRLLEMFEDIELLADEG